MVYNHSSFIELVEFVFHILVLVPSNYTKQTNKPTPKYYSARSKFLQTHDSMYLATNK